MNATAEKTTKPMPTIPTEPLIEDAGIHAQLAPFGAMGALALAAGAVRLAATVSGHEAEVAMGTGATAFVIAVVAAFATKRRFVERKNRRAAVTWMFFAAGWITWIVADGFSVNAMALLSVTGWALSWGWWEAHRIPNVPGVPQEIAPLVDEYVERWRKFIASKGDALPNSRLHSRQDIRAGFRYQLDLVPGRQTMSHVLSELEKVRGGLRLLDEHELIVEKHPTEPAPTVQLTIVTRSPIKEKVLWPGPRVFNSKTGLIDLGPFADGEGHALWRLFTTDSMWGGFICGGTGSGKSRTIESVCMAVTSAGVVVWFADGQNGASSKLLKRKADVFAGTPEDWSAMFDQALRVMQIRQDENDADDLDGFTHTRERPGLLIVVDECHKVFADPGNQQKAATIAREGRKVGVTLLAASQVNTLDAFGVGGEGEALRSSLLMGNGIIMRTKANSAKSIFNVEIDPRTFPKIPGYGFLVDPEERSAPYRGWFVDDATAAKWAEHLRWATLDEVAAGAAGPDYTERHLRREAARAERRARVEAARNGTLHTMIKKVVPAVPQTSSAGYAILNFPKWDPSLLKPPVGISDGHRAVAKALADGRGIVTGQHYCKPSTMAGEVNLSTRRVHDILKDLVAQGVVRAGESQGQYYPTGKQLDSLVA